ncbi:MAG TPA: SpoIIE family protein phosphatase [Deltaproteobacteria bacterium]|jgi:sigma-B regulation protein RsbU (phosphoserine phosphatase)|nr:SpoIIE family protein phosphatase [Deltaproteobacteria bacterium]
MDAPGRLAEYKTTVLLIDDQPIVARAIGKMLRGESDIEFHFCQNPAKAVKTAIEINPTVILQDLVMPKIDGLMLVKLFRSNEKTRDIPLIVLSSQEEPVVKAKAFKLGADDYLVKLPDRVELIARIRHHSKGYINLLERNEVTKRLAAELAAAADYVKKLLPKPASGEVLSTDWRFVPSTSLGGDSFGYHWLDEDHFVIYLLDVCGHGIGAALLSISAINVLRSQSLPNTDFRKPDQVFVGLNEAFLMENHNGMYFTIWYGVYNKSSRTLVYASAGHPPALLVDSAGTKTLGTANMIIGAFQAAHYQSDRININSPSRLYVFSDGAYEIRMPPDNTMWTFESFVELMASQPPNETSHLDRLWEFATRAVGFEGLDDDFTILEISFR